jgi:ribose transport system permease protein
MRELLAASRRHSYWYVLLLAVALLIANIAVLPNFASPSGLVVTLAEFAPIALIAMANTPAILSGGGGIDISVAATMNLVNVLYVAVLLPRGLGGAGVSAVLLLLLGGGIGACNGIMVAVLRYQPVIATIASFFIIDGVSLAIATTPVSAGPNWTDHLAGFPWPLLLIGLPLAGWAVLRRTAYVRNLLLLGADPPAAFSAGIDTRVISISAYALGGVIAAIAGIALTTVLRSADSSLALQYALIGVASVAIGGTALSGGRGGMTGSLLGAMTLYLLQNLLGELRISQNWVQLAYGFVLVAAVLASSGLARRPTNTAAGGTTA